MSTLQFSSDVKQGLDSVWCLVYGCLRKAASVNNHSLSRLDFLHIGNMLKQFGETFKVDQIVEYNEAQTFQKFAK